MGKWRAYLPDDLEIECVSRESPDDPASGITHIGGRNATGTIWRLTEGQAIEKIESGRWRFYVMGGGKRSAVFVALLNGRKYLKAMPASANADSLLTLPECSVMPSG